MSIEEVKAGQRIEAAKINEIIAATNKNFDTSGLFEGSQSFSLAQGATNSYRDFPPMWSCRSNDGNGTLTIRGGIVVVLNARDGITPTDEDGNTLEDALEPYRVEIPVAEATVSNIGIVYVSVNLTDNTATITQNAPEGNQNIAIGEVFSNSNGFQLYKQLGKAELYLCKGNNLSFIQGDGIKIEESYSSGVRLAKFSHNFSFISGDGIHIEEDTTDNKVTVKISVSPLFPDFSFICKDDIKLAVYPDTN